MSDVLSRLYDAKWIFLGAVLIVALLVIIKSFLDVFVYGIFLYYITRPIMRKLEPKIQNRSLLVTVSLLLISLPIVFIIIYTLVLGISQLNAFLQRNETLTGIPYFSGLNLGNGLTEVQRVVSDERTSLNDLFGLVGQHWATFTAEPFNVLSLFRETAMVTGKTIMGLIFQLFLIFLLAFYLLRDDVKLKAWFEETFSGFLEEHDGLFRRYFSRVDGMLQTIFFGNLLSIIFFAVVAIVTFLFLNTFVPGPLQIPFPILLGLLCGITALVPVVGMWLVLVPLFVYLAVNSFMAGTLFSDFLYLIFVVVVISLVVEILPDYVVRPFIARGNVNTGLLMFAYIFGPIVFGVSGLFLGAILLVLLVNYFRVVVPQLIKDRNRAL